MAVDLTTFHRKLAERKAQEEAERANKQQAVEEFLDYEIPEIEHGDRSETDIEIDQVIDRIDILTAYSRWCGKMRPKVSPGQTESIMVSCPIPGHRDEHPSAWVNTDKQVWHCGSCEQGGDKFDLAAMAHGFVDYKSGANFHRLREAMAEDFGYVLKKEIDGSTTVIPPAETLVVTEPEPAQAPDAPDENVIQLYEDEDEEIAMPTLDWRPICPPDTYLDAYMKATVIDDVPEEYHFFHALVGLGFALGKDLTLYDLVPVYGNLFVCTLGRSGTGKSKARRHLDALLQDALPWDGTASPPKGVRRINAPGSAESLIHAFMKPVTDPNDPKKIVYYDPIKGLIDFNELSSLLGRANRTGNVLKPTLMQFYDMEGMIQTTSMTTGSKEAHDPFASALTTSQPAALSNLIDKADEASGFLNRWIFVTGKEKKRIAVGGTKIDMTPAVGPLKEILAYASTFRDKEMQWSEPALDLYRTWFNEVWEPIRKASTNDLLIRIDLTVKKLILLFAANRKEREASAQSVQDAIYCFKYLKATYGIPEGQIGNSQNNEIASAIIYQLRRHFEKHKKGASMRELNRALAYKKFDIKRVTEVLEALVKSDLVEIEAQNTQGPGRRTKRYKHVG